jgi:uncharacterized membrane protein
VTQILLAGESWVTTSIHTKGFDSFTTVSYHEGAGALLAALRAGGHDVSFMPNHVAATDFPSTEAALAAFGVVILSDIGSNTLLLPPATFAGGQAAPNRLGLLRDWVADGGGLAMVGGYLSFQGFEAKANYRCTPLADALPVLMEAGDDRCELPESPEPLVVDAGHPLTRGLDERWPAVLGYQRLVPKRGASTPVLVNGDPLVVTGEHGAGRTLAYATDIGPHWAPEAFVAWPGFGAFWRRAVSWLAGGEAADALAHEASHAVQ